MTQQMILLPLMSGAQLQVPADVAGEILLAALTGQATTAPQKQASQRLEWTHTLCDCKPVNYAAAEKAVADLGDGWRLPTIDELLTLVDRSRHKPAIDTDTFPDTVSDWYWTSTPCSWNTSAVWVVYFGNGASYGNLRDNYGCVRAVRSLPAGQ